MIEITDGELSIIKNAVFKFRDLRDTFDGLASRFDKMSSVKHELVLMATSANALSNRIEDLLGKWKYREELNEERRAQLHQELEDIYDMCKTDIFIDLMRGV